MDVKTPAEEVLASIKNCDFLNKIREIKDNPAVQLIVKHQNEPIAKLDSVPEGYRNLTDNEIKLMKRSNNYCDNWGLILVHCENELEVGVDSLDLESDISIPIRNCTFEGIVVLNSELFHSQLKPATLNVSSTSSVFRKCGIYGSYLFNVYVSDTVLISSCHVISNVFIEKEVVLYGNAEISCSPSTTYANGQSLSVGVEVGGRDTLVYSDMLLATAATVAKNRHDKQMLEDFETAVKEFTSTCEFSMSVVCHRARILHTAKIANVFIGSHALIENSMSVTNVTILSSADEPSHVEGGCFVTNTIMQWGCGVDSMAIVDTSLMCEHSHVERHGKLTESILGPNSGVAEGEITASLCGPFVGFHHQSLLIAAFWPEGKGNIGYGANVGSNHTSKAPDQEIWCGEGVFYGLGCNVKFPTDMSLAPYTVVASGVCTLPQKVCMPFSLINSPGVTYPGVSPAFNEIVPAWVLSDNIFTVLRNEGKYRKRNKAKRNVFSENVFRPSIIDMMVNARAALQNSKDGGVVVYLERNLPGIGKNYLTEKNRLNGIVVYTFYIKYYSLYGWYERLKAKGLEVKNSLDEDTSDLLWTHQRNMILKEFTDRIIQNPAELLDIFASAQTKVGQDTLLSKQKDDSRGCRVIPDYAIVHTKAEDDVFVKETLEKTRLIVEDLMDLNRQISNWSDKIPEN